MRNLSGNREQAAAGHADSGGGGSLGRRSVLGGLAALPVLYGVATAGSGQAAVSGTRPGSGPTVSGGLAVGVERRYNAPLLTPGTRLVLPEGIKAASVMDYYHQPHLASGTGALGSQTGPDGRSACHTPSCRLM